MKIDAHDRVYTYNEKSDRWTEIPGDEEPDKFLLSVVQRIWESTPGQFNIGYASPLIARAMVTARAIGGTAYDFGALREYPEDQRDLIR